jgi:HEAT repeat protein
VGLFGPPDVAKLKAKGDVKGLAQALGYKVGSEKDRHVRRAAAEALGTLGAGAAGALVEALGRETDVEDALIDSLCSIGAPAVEPILSLGSRPGVTSTDAVLVRMGAAAVEPLVAAIKTRGPQCDAAADALDLIGWKPGNDDAGAAYWVVRGRWDKCVEIGGAAVDAIIARLPALAAVEALGRIGDRAALASLLVALESNNDQLSCAAAEALGRIGDGAAVPGLVARLRWGAAAAVAADALGRIGDTRAVEPLIGVLEAERHDVEHLVMRGAAAEALGRIGDPRAVEPLIATVDRGNTITARVAIEALGRICDRTAVVSLESFLRSPYEELRGAAADALDNAGWKPDRDVAGASYWAVRGKWASCIDTGAATDEHLITALERGDLDERTLAANAIVRLGGQAAWPLIKALNGPGREAAAGALVKIGGQAVPALISALGHVDSRADAADVLADIGDPRAVEPLIAALEGGSWTSRKASARALVAIYESGGLAPDSRQAILGRAADITADHDDGQSHYDGYPPGYCGHGDGFEHGDRGIGLPVQF